MEADGIINGYDIIFIDEIQFFKDNFIFCEKWANQGKDIVLAGLISTFERKLFSGMDKLIPLVEYININSAVCIDNGNEAYFSMRTNNDKNETIIGDDNIYKAVDRKTYYQDDEVKIKNYLEMINEFNNIYNAKNNTSNKLNIDKVKEFIISHNFNFNFIDCILSCNN